MKFFSQLEKASLENLASDPTGWTGRVYYNTTFNVAKVYNGSAWVGMGGGLSAWVTSTPYVAGDVVLYSKNAYVCVTGHTAAANFEADDTSGYWAPINQPVANKNLMTVGSNFEDNDTAGWTTAHTTLSSLVPNQASGSWTSATNKALSIESSAPLAGKYSLKEVQSVGASTAGDMVVSKVYNMPIMYQAKMMVTGFAYQASASPTNLTWSGLSTNTKQIYIYDVTNSTWIQPAGVYGMVQSSGVGTVEVTWQSPYNMTQFRVAIIDVNASAGTYTMLYDEAYTQPQKAAPSGAVVTDWQSYSLSITASTTNPTKGTIVVDNARWRRVGDSMEIFYDYQQSAGGTAGSGTYAFSLPSGYSIDTNKMSSTDSMHVGNGYTYNGSANYQYIVRVNNGTSLYLTYYDTSQASGTYFDVGSTNLHLNSAVMWYKFHARVPILGWSSNTLLASDSGDQRIVAAKYGNSAGTSITTSGVDVPFATKEYDTTNSFDGTNFTAPSAGIYRVKAYLTLNSFNLSTSNNFGIDVFKKPSGGAYSFATNLFMVFGTGTTTSWRGGGSADLSLNAGDQIKIFSALGSGGPTGLYADSKYNYIEISKLQGPSQVAATETIKARYYGLNTTILTSDTLIKNSSGATKVYDSHGAYGSTTGVFTCPAAGTYRVTFALRSTTGYTSSSAGAGSQVYLYRDSVLYARIMEFQYQVTGVTLLPTYWGSISVQCLAGQTLDLRANRSASLSGNIVLDGGSENWIEFERTGNY